MGFLFTLIYVSLALSSPADLIPSFAEYRVEVLIVIAALLFSAPSLLRSRFFEIPQVYLLAGLFAAVFLSQAVTSHWIGGGVIALGRFLPGAIVFYLILLNCRTVGHLEMLAFVLAVVAGVIVMEGAQAYLAKDIDSQFVFVQGETGAEIMRIRGLGFLHDPNDLSQFLVMVIPLVWTMWRQARALRNILFVIAPTIFFIWGIYLTHSRGAILALVVILLLAFKDRIGIIPAILGATIALSSFMAMDFAGGRAISVQAGSDRLALWSEGLQLFKQSPLFGVGYLSFANQGRLGHTAHNSFVVCLAELGILGYSLWMGLVVFTFSGLNSLIASLKAHQQIGPNVSDGELSNEGPMLQISAESREAAEKRGADVDKWAKALRISLAGFLAAAWFLSRAYVLTIYLVLGMAVALLSFTSVEEELVARQPVRQLVSLTAKFGFAAIAVVYVWVRVRSVL